MGAPSPGDAFTVADILGSTVDPTTKKIHVKLGSVQGDTTSHENVEWWQPAGIASRPSKPGSGRAPQAMVLTQGGLSAAIAAQDVRSLSVYGTLSDGELCLYAPGEDATAQGRVLLKKNGSVHIFTKEGNDSAGTGVQLSVNSDGSINITGSSGNAVLLENDGAVKAFNGSGSVQIKADGHIKIASGTKVEISGASVTLGGASALPVAIGPNVVTAVAALQAQISALQIEIAAIQTQCAASFNAIIAIPPVTAAAGVVTPAVTAATAAVGVAAGVVVASAATVSTASAIIPSLRTSSD